MKVAVLHPSAVGSTSPFKDLDPDCDPARFLPRASSENISIHKATAVRQVVEISQRGFDVAINLCDGAWDEDRPGIEVVQALEKLDVAYTGAGPEFYDPSRTAMKMGCHSAGLSIPAYVLARGDEDIERAAASLRFPLIVKHPGSYSSIGMSRDSRVSDWRSLRREAARIIAAYGAALVEEFIEGREFTVLVAEPRDGAAAPWILQPAEYTFPAGESFQHFDLKWRDYARMEIRPVEDAPLAARLRDAAAKTFLALNGSGYGRCDMRMDAAGDIHVLEINPNCGVFYPEGQYGAADFILARDAGGHRGFVEHLIACAIRRRDRNRRPWEIRYDRASGFGLYAARPIKAGEVVQTWEERPHPLVSRRHVDRAWDALRRRWFDQYAWPLTDEVHVMWSADPDEWRPVNHSCDPNTWLDGLDVMARRDIARDEAITMDYATFSGPGMEPFDCRCGTALCRRVIRGDDCRLPELRERYRDHVSDYVKRAFG